MKPPTAEQRERAAQRRAKLRELTRSVAAMTPQQRAEIAARCGVVTVEGRSLSIFNACLVWQQRPTASLVGGYRQWRRAGRQVRKGEQGIAIWVPIGQPEPAANGEPADGAKRFVLGYVFDVTQTDDWVRT